jgi:hypothetical protein
VKYLITEKQLNLIENKLNLKSRTKEQEDDAVKFYSEKIINGNIKDSEPFPERVIKKLPIDILQKYVNFYINEMKDDIEGFLELQNEIEMQDEYEEYENPINKIFNFLPNNIKNLYVKEKIKKEDWLTIDEFKYINDDLKKEYIKNRGSLFKDEYDSLDNNMKKWYIDFMLSDGYNYQHVSDIFFNDFSDEQKIKYFNLMKGNKFYPKYEDFTKHQKEYFKSKNLLENINLKSRIKYIEKDREDYINNILNNKELKDLKPKEIEIISHINENKVEEILYEICDNLSEFESYLHKYDMVGLSLYRIYFNNIKVKDIPENDNIKKYNEIVGNHKINKPHISWDDTYFYFFEPFKLNNEYFNLMTEHSTVGELINYIKKNNRINEGIELKSRTKELEKESLEYYTNLLNNNLTKNIQFIPIKVLKKMDDDLIKKYIRLMLENYYSINKEIFNILNKNLKLYFFQKAHDKGLRITRENWENILNDDDKLIYIQFLNNNNIELKYYMKSWYERYKNNNNLKESKLNLKSRAKEQLDERNIIVKEILNKNILDVKQKEYGILKSVEKKEIIQKFIDFIKKEFNIKISYSTINYDLNEVNFNYLLEKNELYYKFYNLGDFLMFSVGILSKTRTDFSDIVQASKTPFKTIRNLIKLSIEKYLKSTIKENKLNLKSRAKEQELEKENYINKILDRPIETVTFKELEKLCHLFWDKGIDKKVMGKIKTYFEEKGYLVKEKTDYLRIDYYNDDIRHIIDLSVDKFDGIVFVFFWDSKNKKDTFLDADLNDYTNLKEIFDLIEKKLNNES